MVAGNDPPADVYSPAEYEYARDDGNCSSCFSSSSSSSLSETCSLPCLIAATAPKRPDQPAGLTLKLRHPKAVSTKARGVDGSSKSRRRRDSSRASSLRGASSVVIGSISSKSPFHPNNINISNALREGDEILTVNGHRVKDPKRAAHMIKSTTSGYLTILASRGRERRGMEGTAYHLARVERNPYVADLNQNCGVDFDAMSNSSLVRVSKIIEERCPFAKTGLKVGDAVLSIGGEPVRSAEQAGRQLMAGNGADNKLNKGQGGDGSRVVVLLAYSFWDMRKQVLRDELQSGNGSEHPWDVSWSHQQTEAGEGTEESPGRRTSERGEEEFVTLRIPDTAVAFRLDFNGEGACLCRDPLAALGALTAELRRNSGRRGRHNHSYSHVVDGDETTDSDCSDSPLGSSRHEAQSALDLLYREHVQPAVDALNRRTREQVLSLATAAATDIDARVECGRALSPPAVSPGGSGAEERRTARQVRSLARALAADHDGSRPGGEGSGRRKGGEGTVRERGWESQRAPSHLVIDPGSTRADERRVAKGGGRRPLRPYGLDEVHDVNNRSGEKVVHASVGDRRGVSPPVNDHKSTQVEEGRTATAGDRRSPQPYQFDKLHAKNSRAREKGYRTRVRDRHGLSPRANDHRITQAEEPMGVAAGRRSPQPYQLENLQIKPEGVGRGTFRRSRSPQPYKWEKARIGLRKRIEETNEAADLDSFQEQLGMVELRPRRESANAKALNFMQRAVDQQNGYEGSSHPSTKFRAHERNELSPPPAPYHVARPIDLTQSEGRPGRLRRRPSSLILPGGFAGKRASNQTELSALSESDESSRSGTSTTSSNDSSTYTSSNNGSGSSSEDNEGPRSSRRLRAGDPRCDDQGRSSAVTARGLSNSTEIVVWDGRGRADEPGGRRHVSDRGPPSRAPKLKMRNGDVRSRYKVLPRVLGTGSFGTVRSCLHRQTNERLAVKSILKGGNILKGNAMLLRNEIALVQRVSHHSVVSVVDVIQDREYIHIVMEECRGGDLFDKIVDGGVRLGERRACEIIGSLLDAIAYLHERNIVHRDLKAEHIMLSNSDINSSPIKIIDFGLAIRHDPRIDPPMTAFAGSAFTVAPEVVKQSYGKECDLWSVGVITYFLLTQKMPFNAKTDREIFQKIVTGAYGFPQWTETGLSEEAKDFIDRLLVVDPKRRLTAKQALSHLWIRKHNHASLMDSINSQELLALVPVKEKAIVVRRQPREPKERRGPARHEVGTQQRRVSGRAAAAKAAGGRNPRPGPKPSGPDVGGSGGGVASSGRPTSRAFGRVA